MVFLPKPVFKRIMGFCDNRIETNQKMYHKQIIASLKILSVLDSLVPLNIKIFNMANGHFGCGVTNIKIPDLIICLILVKLSNVVQIVRRYLTLL